MAEYPQLVAFEVDGYRPFGRFLVFPSSLNVIVGVNGSGKSSFFEFLQVLRDGMSQAIPPGLAPGASMRRIYHNSVTESIIWHAVVSFPSHEDLHYTGVLTGPYGQHIMSESVHQGSFDEGHVLLAVRSGQGEMYEPSTSKRSEISFDSTDRLALGTITNRAMSTLRELQNYVRKWCFYSSFNIAANAIRSPVITQQNPVLREDASNLSDVLLHLRNEHDQAFAELNRYMRLFVPGFKELRVRSYGAPGQVMAFWREEGVDQELSLADLSDGIFRLLCWTVLCVDPNPPSLICIDEPDQGVHPRTLPILADLFKQASRRTQVILATHSSYFLSQFDLSQIAVMRKEDGRAVYVKPATSKALVGMLEDFGAGEIEILHCSEELERLP